MLDPITAFGLASGLVQIVDFSGRVIIGLRAVRKRYNDAGFTIDLLIGQLCTLRAALQQITEWLSTSLAATSSHESFIKDLNTSLEGCNILMTVLEQYVEDCISRDTSKMRFKRKIKHLFNEDTIRAHSEQLHSQIEALNLLLTACNFCMISERLQFPQYQQSQCIVARPSDCKPLRIESQISSSEIAPMRNIGYNEKVVQTLSTPDQYQRSIRNCEEKIVSESYQYQTLALQCQQVAMIYRRCDKASCLQRSGSSMRLCYRFPTWLLYRTISVMMTISSLRGPELLLRTQHIVSPESPIFQYARKGDTDGIKRLLTSGEASIFDVTKDDGASVLGYAVWFRNVESTKLLLDVGADPTQGRWAVFCPMDLASIVLHDVRDTSLSQRHVQEAFKSIFDWESYYEEQQYTEIHRIVLGDINKDLEDALQEFHWKINNLDACGCSALWWSCSRGDVEATRLLLKYGADVNTCDVEGDYPLHATVFSCNSDCTALLLDYGADVNRRDKSGYTAWRNVCYFRDDPNHVKVFLKHGADVNLPDNCGRSPLLAAADINAAESIRLLLASGAYPDLQDDCGLTALHAAIQNNCHEAVQAILEHETYHRITTNPGKTALHIAASFGDVAMMECLEKFGLRGPDFLAKDANGKIARDYLQDRGGFSPRLIQAYNALEKQVINAFVKPSDKFPHSVHTDEDNKERVIRDDSQHDTDLFVDAVEHISHHKVY